MTQATTQARHVVREHNPVMSGRLYVGATFAHDPISSTTPAEAAATWLNGLPGTKGELRGMRYTIGGVQGVELAPVPATDYSNDALHVVAQCYVTPAPEDLA